MALLVGVCVVEVLDGLLQVSRVTTQGPPERKLNQLPGPGRRVGGRRVLLRVVARVFLLRPNPHSDYLSTRTFGLILNLKPKISHLGNS